MSRNISNFDDVIDSRDVIARLEELRDERTALADHLEEADQEFCEVTSQEYDAVRAEDIENDAKLVVLENQILERRGNLKEWDEENGDELKALESLAEEAEGYAPDWRYGCALIRDSYFEEYAEELVKDIGDIPRDIPHYIAIDWKATAENIQVDYTSVDFDGVTYWVR